jgi:hypothetical protein
MICERSPRRERILKVFVVNGRHKFLFDVPTLDIFLGRIMFHALVICQDRLSNAICMILISQHHEASAAKSPKNE